MADEPVEVSMMRGLVAEAMMKSLDDKKRDELVKGAIATLITPKEGSGYSYGRKHTSPLEDAFNDAIQQVAREMVFQMLKAEGNPIREKLLGLVSAALAKVEVDTNTLATEISVAVVKALRETR